MAGAQGPRSSQLSDETGGEAFGFSSALSEQLANVAREQDEYYRVAYTPREAKEGSCHAIKISMNTRGLNARGRNEYCTEKPVDVVAGKIAGQALEARAANISKETAGGAGTMNVAMQLPYFYTGTNRASVRLSAEMVPAGMKFEKDKTGLHGQFDIVATVLRPDGGTAARFADTVDIDQDSQQSADQFTRTPWHYEHQFTVAAGTYTVQMAIGAGPSAVGKVEMPLKVDPWTGAGLGIGGIAFSTDLRTADQADPAGGLCSKATARLWLVASSLFRRRRINSRARRRFIFIPRLTMPPWRVRIHPRSKCSIGFSMARPDKPERKPGWQASGITCGREIRWCRLPRGCNWISSPRVPTGWKCAQALQGARKLRFVRLTSPWNKPKILPPRYGCSRVKGL